MCGPNNLSFASRRLFSIIQKETFSITRWPSGNLSFVSVLKNSSYSPSVMSLGLRVHKALAYIGEMPQVVGDVCGEEVRTVLK